MILTCPECGAQFNIKARMLGEEGRRVRCAVCSHVWHSRPQDAASPNEGESLSHLFATKQEPSHTEPPKKKKTTKKLRKSYSSSRSYSSSKTRHPFLLIAVLLVLSGVAFGYWGRFLLVKAYPSLSPLYARLGLLNSVGFGLSISPPKVRFTRTKKGIVLYVEGVVTNTLKRPLRVPPLEGRLLDQSESVLYTWSFSTRRSNLTPGGSVPYRTKVVSPPSTSRQVSITFSRKKKEAKGRTP